MDASRPLTEWIPDLFSDVPATHITSMQQSSCIMMSSTMAPSPSSTPTPQFRSTPLTAAAFETTNSPPAGLVPRYLFYNSSNFK